ncbi:MAG: phosphatase [Bacteroidetes bacterium]|nr:phosphatase [Bacteroidota bacterium]
MALKYIVSENEIAEKLKKIKAFIFDWDGVFNNGEKQAGGSSSFNEVDSMGTNLLRFAYFLKNQQPPITAIISGEKNETAFYFSKRECFNYSFFKIPHKIDALNFICSEKKISPSEVAYFFDDVLDLSIANTCGLRILIARPETPLFTEYCIKNKLTDVHTTVSGKNFAVRQACESLMKTMKSFDDVLQKRTNYSSEYANYITQRNNVNAKFYTLNTDKKISNVEL